MRNRTIRLFVSSTFSDLKAERDLLQREVFPNLQRLCLSKGLRFQAIDLRWGVPEEAGKDNRTMRICQQELKRCQEGPIKPNFLVLLGDRYGWRPLPEILSADVFNEIRGIFTKKGTNNTKLLDTWYRHDDNAVPPEYVLQPRTGRFEEFAVWQREVEQPLLAALSEAAESLLSSSALPAPLRENLLSTGIGLSATHQEILHGALDLAPDEVRSHVHTFSRTITGTPSPPHRDFADFLPGGSPDSQSPDRLKSLKSELKDHLGGESNFHNYSVPWQGDGIFTDSDLESFAKRVLDCLTKVITTQVAALEQVSREEQEEQAHRAFCEERRSGFIGRDEPLAAVKSYLRAGSSHPLAIIGPAGSGKSALLAEAVHRARSESRDPKAEILSRFIGVTPGSSDLIELLRDLVTRIRACYPHQVEQDGIGCPPDAAKPSCEPKEKEPDDREIPNEINPLTIAFHEALGRAGAKRPLWLFLDALDQFRDTNLASSLSWLPQKLPENVRIVVSSALPSRVWAAHPPPTDHLSLVDLHTTILRNLALLAPGPQTVQLGSLTPADGEVLLDRWLTAAGRTLDKTQCRLILDAFAAEGNALWLRVAAEEAAHWPSWHKPEPPPPGLHDLLATVLERLSRNEEHGAVFVKHALGYLACARNGLAEDEIIGVLGADTTVIADIIARSPTERAKPKAARIQSLPVAIWVRFHGDIAFYLSERLVQGAALFGFYHRSFGEAVERFCLETDADRRPLHETMAHWFGEQPWFLPPAGEDGKPPRAPERSDPANTRKASELPFHLQRVGELTPDTDCWDPLVDVLCDLDCIETKAGSGLIYELVSDYNAALAALPEFRDENECLAKSDAAMIAYNKALRDYAVVRCNWWLAKELGESKPEPQYPAMPAEFQGEAQHAFPGETSPRAAQLRDFANFVTLNSEQLAGDPAETQPIAFNHDEDGIVHSRAARSLSHYSRPWLRRIFRPDNPALRSQSLRVFHGHRDKVLTVDCSPDGHRVLSASADNTLALWDLATGENLRTFRRAGTCIASSRMNSDGSLAASVGDHDTNLSLWDTGTGTHLSFIEVEQYGSWVSDVSVSPKALHAATLSSGKNLRFWDIATGKQLNHIECPVNKAMSRTEFVVYTPDARRCITSGLGVSCIIWDVTTGKCLRNFGEASMNAGRVAISADGRWMASPCPDNTIRLWDIETGACIHVFEGHSGKVHCVSFSPDGLHLVSGSADHSLRLWDVKDNNPVGILGYHDYAVLSACFCRDGRRVISGSEDNTVRLWDVNAETSLSWVQKYGIGGVSVSVSLDGSRAVALSGNNVLTIWNAESGELLQRFALRGSGLVSACVSGDGRLVYIGLRDGIGVYDLQTGTYYPIIAIDIRGPWAHAVNISSDGRRAVSASWDNAICLWDLEAKRFERLLSHDNAEVRSVSINADGRWILSVHKGNILKLWDAITGALMGLHEICGVKVRSASISPDACWALVVGTDKNLHLFNLGTGEWQAHYRSNVPVRSGAVSETLSRIVCGTEDGQLHFLTTVNFTPVTKETAADER